MMNSISEIISVVMICLGAFFLFVGGLGIIRLPDFYTRSHAISKSDTLGIMMVLAGLAVYEGFTVSSIKLIIAIIFVAVANPTGTHALARAGFKYGLRPWPWPWFRRKKQKAE